MKDTRGWSHQPVQTPSFNISDYYSVKSGGATFVFEHNPRQFHGWNRTERLVWLGHEPLLLNYCRDEMDIVRYLLQSMIERHVSIRDVVIKHGRVAKLWMVISTPLHPISDWLAETISWQLIWSHPSCIRHFLQMPMNFCQVLNALLRFTCVYYNSLNTCSSLIEWLEEPNKRFAVCADKRINDFLTGTHAEFRNFFLNPCWLFWHNHEQCFQKEEFKLDLT